MNEDVKAIHLMLENYDTVTIPRDMIGQVIFKNFREDFRRRTSQSIDLFKIAGYVVLQIKDANKIFEEYSTTVENDNGEDITFFDALKDNNITNIVVEFERDGKKDCYNWYVDWNSENSEYENSLQTTTEVFGDVWIAIGEKAQEDLECYFPKTQEQRDKLWNRME